MNKIAGSRTERKTDEIDLELLDLLQKNAKARIHAIAKKMRLPPSTIHHRIKKLEEDGLIKRWTIEKNNSLLGLKMKAHVMIFVDLAVLTSLGRSQKDVLADIKKIANVESVDIVTGDSDLVATVRCRDMDEFQNILLSRIQSIKGITKTKTMIVVAES